VYYTKKKIQEVERLQRRRRWRKRHKIRQLGI